MVRILDKRLEVPIIQGGMGIGVSLGNLAGNVALCGGMGVISTVNAGYREPDFDTNPYIANIRALKNEIKKAFGIAKGKGMVAINVMVAVNHYEETVKAAIESGIDAVISGAGLPFNLPEYTKGSKTAAAPIVSSGKAAALICKKWDTKYGVAPDFIIIEGVKAGGHLGFKKEEILDNNVPSLKEILSEVLISIEPYEQKYGRKIPIFVAGGIYDGKDMAEYTKSGAAGVQMATRFIATKECDADTQYKKMMVEAKDEDITIIKSPVGMPGRALLTPLIKRLNAGENFLPDKCNLCLKACPHGKLTPYCISRALIEAVKGNRENGLFFCGANVGRIDKITTVRELIDELILEFNEWR